MSKAYRGISDSQANAEALARRGAPYTAASETSLRVQWDWHRREPADLREATRMARKAYADEVPERLHDGPSAIGEDGTPRMSARAVGYIFGSEFGDDATRDPETGERDLVGWYYAPFRAHLAALYGSHDKHPEDYICTDATHRRAAIVRHVTLGSQGPMQAAIIEGVPSWCAKLVAEDALRSFLRGLTDLRLHVQRERESLQDVVA